MDIYFISTLSANHLMSTPHNHRQEHRHDVQDLRYQLLSYSSFLHTPVFQLLSCIYQVDLDAANSKPLQNLSVGHCQP